MIRRMGGAALTVTGFLACPCHLIITLPLILSLLAGTRLSNVLSQHTGLVYMGAGSYFVVALTLGVWCLFGKRGPKCQVNVACPGCTLDGAEIPVQKRSVEPEHVSDTGRKRATYGKTRAMRSGDSG